MSKTTLGNITIGYSTFISLLKKVKHDRRLFIGTVVSVLIAMLIITGYLIVKSSNKNILISKNPSTPPIQDDTIQSIYIQPALNSVWDDSKNTIKNKDPQILKITVKSGDTLDSISKSYGVKVGTIAESNGLSNDSTLKEGQELLFPSVDGILHKIKSGETMWDLSVTYKIDLDNIVSVNKLDSPDKLKIDQQIIIPGADKVKVVNNESVRDALSSSIALASIWPVRGSITSRYGLRWGTKHNGIDIAAATGSNIYAFLSGKVVFSGWNDGGYGYLVIVDHGNGLESYYGHCSKLLVKAGQNVEKGQNIAEVGSTGDSTGPHCHFEIRKNGTAVNPFNYLR